MRHFLLLSVLFCSVASAADRPNIVLIFIDDMGWTDTGSGGSDLYETPNINSLPNENVLDRETTSFARDQ